jgi:plastocyanin
MFFPNIGAFLLVYNLGVGSSDISNAGYQQQIITIRGMSGTQVYEQETITLTITNGSIVNNKIIVGVKRNNAVRLPLTSCSASITATVRLSTSLNVSYNQGSGNIVAYLNSAYATPSAPAHLSGYENDQVHIAPLSPTIPSYSLVYNENQAPLNKSEWRILNSSNFFTGQTLTSASNSFALVNSQNNYTYEAQMKKLCNVTFQNSFSGGIITAGGSSGNSPQIRQVVEANTITATAQQFYINLNNSGLDYSFSNWDGSSTSLSKTFTIYNHEQHTANYIRKANTSQVFEWDFTNVAVGNNIRLTWNEHPNTNVTQYKIWRRDKNGTESYIGTVNRGTTSFTDYDYQYASENDPDKGTLFYNVSVYCSLDGGSWSSDGMKLVT